MQQNQMYWYATECLHHFPSMSSVELSNVCWLGRSQNVRDQGQATEDAVKDLISGSMAMLQPRQPPASLQQQLSQRQFPSMPAQQQPANAQPGLSQALQGGASQVQRRLATKGISTFIDTD